MGLVQKYGLFGAVLHMRTRWLRGWSVIFYSAVFKIKLQMFGCEYGKNLVIDGKVYLSCKKRGQIHIGDNFKLNSAFGSNLAGITNNAVFQLIGDGKIVIGNNCGFTSTVLSSRSEINIGDNVMIGANVRILDHDYHAADYLSRRTSEADSKNCKTDPVIIGEDVFIGMNAIILKGVSVGPRSVIGAGSVVTLKSIPADSVVAGNPAIIIRSSAAKG
jgi:acetyltransferase-like isoleucine patch superfamily enzyme